MLELYLVKNINDRVPKSSFSRFSYANFSFCFDGKGLDDTCCSLLKQIDNVEYAGGYGVYLPNSNSGYPYYIGEISSESKTGIVVVRSLQDRIFYIGHCGKTALRAIFQTIEQGKVYIDYPVEIPSFDREIMLHCDIFTGVVSGDKELTERIKEYYGDSIPTSCSYTGGDNIITDNLNDIYYHEFREQMMDYHLYLKSRVTVIDYDSDIEKSSLFRMIRTQFSLINMYKKENYRHSAYKTEDLRFILDGLIKDHSQENGQIIVMDDGVNILTSEDRNIILNDKNNQYIIFTHNTAAFGSLPNECFAQLAIDENKTFLKYR